jgi:hypothetical protein
LTSIHLLIGAELAFQLDGLPPVLAAAARERTRYYLTDRLPDSCQPLRISVEPAPPDLHETPVRELLSEPPLIVRQAGSQTIFELPGMVCRCDPERSFAGISIEQPDRIPAAHFTNRVLIALLLQLGQVRGWIGLHAAAIVAGDRGILLPGASSAGKSTIFGNARAAGLGVLSDDLVWLRETKDAFSVVPFPDASYSSGDRSPTHEEVPLAAIVCPSITPQDDNQLLPIAAREALTVLISQGSFMAAGDWMGKRFTTLVRAARAVPCFRLNAGRNQAEVPRLLAALVSP